MRRCFFCGYEYPHTFEVFRSTICPGCSRDVKICKNCKFYSPGAHWDCRETVPELVKEKDKANFCSYFKFNESAQEKDEGDKTKQEEAKDAFNKLFGD